jgi:voltage-gated potassium channel
MDSSYQKPQTNLRRKLHELIFEADTRAGKLFDVILIVIIIISVVAVMLDSIQSINEQYGFQLYIVEWVFTILFTVEYVLRLFCVGKPLKYAFSFYGIVDFLSIFPTYFSILYPGSQYLLVIRILRVLRVFRVLKVVQYLTEARMLKEALIASRRKIFVFIFVVFTVVIIVGSMMYLIEGEENGFTSIPRSIYWSIVTLTTVGYGDLSPQTTLGQALASFVMILGYGLIAVPTGIVSVEISKIDRKNLTTQSCPECSAEGHDSDAEYCKHCGSHL